MPGYFTLNHKNFEALFQEEKGDVEKVPRSEQLNPYVFEKRGNVVIVHTPVQVGSLTEFLEDIKGRMGANDHLLLGVVGPGATEQHIVTMYIPPNGARAEIYDSKSSNPERFFSAHPSRNSIGGIIRSALNTLNPFSEKTREISLEHLKSKQLRTANFHALGTQSFFDGISCGYHTGNNLKALATLLEEGTNPTADQLLVTSKNPVTTSAQLLAKVAPDMSFSTFLKKAWQDTFLPLVAEKERDKYHFGHYFMGWPADKKGSKAAYFLTLKFITSPLTNLLTLAIEFPLNILSETFSFLKNKVLSWAPTNPITQGIRSLVLLLTIGLQATFKGINYLLRTITSPLTSFKAAREIHPVLGYVSALASVLFLGAGLAALAVFAPPIIAALAPSMGPGAISLLSTLAYPFIQLFSLASLSISTATGAMLAFISGGLFLGILHQIGKKKIYPDASETTTEQSDHTHKAAEDLEIVGSNVGGLLPRSDHTHKDEKDFALPVEETNEDFEEIMDSTPPVEETSDSSDINPGTVRDGPQ